MTDTGDSLDAATEHRIDRFLDDWMADEDVPGCSVAVFDADGVLYATGLGARSLEEGEPATPETRYYAGSVTKTVTAMAVLQLVEGGDLALEDAVAEYVPFLGGAPGEPVTVHELLSHTSGLPACGVRENIASQRDLQLHLDGGAAHRVTEDPPWMYSNAGYKILGEVIAAVDGRAYTDYVAEEVLDPLGMERSTFDQGVLWEDDDATPGYQPEGDDRVPAEEPVDFANQPANGGLVSTATDLTRVLRCLLNGGTLEGAQALASESIDAMTDRHARCLATIDGEEMCYGYGVGVDPFLGDRLVGHTGNVGRSQAYVGALTDRELGVALAVNTAGVAVDDYGKGVLALAAGADPHEAVAGLAVQEKLEAVAGTYEAYRGPTATVAADGGHITIEVGGWRDEAFPAFPTSLAPDDYAFYAVRGGMRAPIEFRDTDDGMILLESRYRFEET